MARSLTKEDLAKSVPNYVHTAFTLVDAVIEKALDQPDGRIQLSAFHIGRIGIFNSARELHQFWDYRDVEGARMGFNVDVPLEDQRLALSRTREKRKAWIYDPALTTGHVRDVEATWTLDDWNTDKARSDPRGFVTPQFSLIKDENDDPIHRISVSKYTLISDPGDVKAAWLRLPEDLFEVSAEAYRQAGTLRRDEESLLERQGIYSLHDAKLTDMLHVIRMVTA